jgi:hypothetical protein
VAWPDHHREAGPTLQPPAWAIDGFSSRLAGKGGVAEQPFKEFPRGVAPTDPATAHRSIHPMEQRLDAPYGPLRCTVHLEPLGHTRPTLIPGTGNG